MTPLTQTLFFDLDDTIVRFSAGQPDFWRLACRRHLPSGAPVEAILNDIALATNDFWGEPARAFWGRQNMREARRRVARAGLTPHGFDKWSEPIADDMTRSKEDAVRPFPGALEALGALRERGHRLALLTNGSSEFQRRKLHRYDLERFFELVLIEGEQGFGKPDPRFFQHALTHFCLRPEQATMIGDNLSADIGGAHAVGLPSVWHDAHRVGLPPNSQHLPLRVIEELWELLE